MAEKASDYSGATINLDEMEDRKLPDVKYSGSSTPADATSQDRPISASSTKSTGSRTNPSSYIHLSEYSAQRFFSYRAQQTGIFARAVQAAQDQIVKAEEDGPVKGVWLLSEIDHWDNEREKLVLLCQKSIFVIHYDFIRFTSLHTIRIELHQIESIRLGQLTYPSGSFMSRSRDHGGMRFSWGKESELKWSQRWNPWSGDIPFTTFAHHPLHYLPKERENVMYNMEYLFDALVSAVNDAYLALKPGEKPIVEEGEVTITSYASFWSMIYNQSRLGYNKERGGISY